MSFRSKKSRNVQASKAKDATVQSVDDILSQVIHDVNAEESQAAETLPSSGFNQTEADKGGKAVTQPAQGTTTEADDAGFNKRTRSRGHTPSPSQSLATEPPPRQLRSSLRRSVVRQPVRDDTTDDEVEHQGAEDPPMAEPTTEARNVEPNDDVRDSQRNTSGRQSLVTRQGRADSPSQPKALKKSSLWVEDDDEPAELEDFQPRHIKISKWNDDIEFDDIEEVEMRDSNGKRGRKGGKINPRHVWSLQPGVRFVVPFNSLDQPIRKGGNVLVRFLGDVAKTGDICPIGEESWFQVDKRIKANMVSLVREKFVLPERGEIDREVLKLVSNKWRIYRHRLKKKYKKPGKTQEQVASVVPKGVVPTQWTKLVAYWFSDKYENLSVKGKEARASQIHMHTTGSKSFAQKRDEFEKIHGREPGALEWFVQTHQRKDGTYVEDASKEFLDTAATLLAERGAPSSSKERVALENEVFNELMYSDDDKPVKRPLGYGTGVSKTKVFGVQAELRKREFSASGFYHFIPYKRARVGGEARSSYMESSDMSAEVERLNFAVVAMGETNELMQAQLQMQSKQLKRQSKQLQMQSQQMEGLQFQLQQVTSLVTKFGAMLKKPSINPTPRQVHRSLSVADVQTPPGMLAFDAGESESSEWDSD